MTKNLFPSAGQTGLMACSALLLTLTGCVTAGPGQRSSYPPRPVAVVRTTIMIEDDYDYYPRYEIYYSRRRNEYVYRDSNAWVRRSDLRGITLAMLGSGPSVRMDFHDSPEFHHGRIVQSFPRNWERSPQDHDDRPDHREDKKDDRKRN